MAAMVRLVVSVSLLLALTLPLFSVYGLLQRSKITLDNNEYKGILIAIADDVKENANLLENLQEILTGASGALYRATKQRAFFKEITILLPNTWSNDLVNVEATSEIFDAANAIVTKHENVGRETPYTNQFGSCGEEAEYIHLTDKFILDKQWTVDTYGDPAKVIVHEWGHLRWGLFNEYATNSFERFYLDDKGNVEPTRCSRAVIGKSYDSETGIRCNVNPKSGKRPGKYCRFLPTMPNRATGSYLFMSFLNSVVEFCHSDVTGDPLSLHNAMAPNQQNIQCSYRSAWDVMLESEDFKNDSNPARQVTDTTPTFRVVKIAPLRIVLVLDVSGSMDDNDRIGTLNQLATKYIQATVPDGHSVGIVEFENDAVITSDLRELQDDKDRDELANLLPKTTREATCIGCGLESGIDVLEKDGHSARGGILVLITDGEENREPYINEVKPSLISKGVCVDTLAFGTSADEKLLSLSEDTCGLSFLYSEDVSSTGLSDAFSATITSRIGGSSNSSFELYSEKQAIPSTDTLKGTIVIDSTIGKSTKFFFLWTTSPISVVLYRPNGTAIDETSLDYERNDGARTVSIEITGIAESGTWLYEVTANQSQQVEISVQSNVREDTQPIRVTTTTSNSLITETPAMTNMYAQVQRGYAPIVKADVVATVERPQPHSPVKVNLLDNGAGADFTEDDGVYSGVFLDFVNATCPNCRYNVKVTAGDTDGTAQVPISTFTGGVLPIRPPNRIDENTNITEPVGPFYRVTSGGVIQAPLAIPPGDNFPPSRITDLRVAATSYDNQTVTLAWTAPGNDLDRGTASEYHLRYSEIFEVFYKNFTNGMKVSNSNLTVGNLSSPKTFGEMETMTVLMPSKDENITYFFAIRARDAPGNVGPPSNIVSATIVYDDPDEIINITTESLDTTLDTETEADMQSGQISIFLIIGCSVAGALLVIVVAIILSKCLIKNKKYLPDKEGVENIAF
ncbi:calcium-activated chloride channel regulator 1-like [Ptychodera flava]|uniref:calcium-activated chloride channel regulator 1-like n=1 Tax=Ptychodera flava TaxID=63121 RepID=UPI00396A7598